MTCQIYHYECVLKHKSVNVWGKEASKVFTFTVSLQGSAFVSKKSRLCFLLQTLFILNLTGVLVYREPTYHIL